MRAIADLWEWLVEAKTGDKRQCQWTKSRGQERHGAGGWFGTIGRRLRFTGCGESSIITKG